MVPTQIKITLQHIDKTTLKKHRSDESFSEMG